jgi:hypothetical protein
MRKKTRVSKTWVTLITLGGLIFFLTSFTGGGGGGSKIDWEQHPPIANRVTAQQLAQPLETGENMLVEITYDRGAIDVAQFVMYPNERTKVVFHDDGLNGDAKAGDFVFSSYITEDIEAFQKKLNDFDYSLSSFRGELVTFNGRLGTTSTRAQAFFNRESFAAGNKIDLPRDLFNLPSRSPAVEFGPSLSAPTDPAPPPSGPAPLILKQNSLLVTDLSVVEDPARTFDPCNGAFGSGNPNGAWTFGTLMKGMAFQSFTGVSARSFIQHWLRRWTVDTVVNSESVPNRSARMISLIIAPWINKARHATVPAVNAGNWISLWDGIHQDSILKYAPFRLTAIVNRLDLRGNSGYGGFNNTGETRFIYSVIKNTSTSNCRDSIGSGGLDGFNVILEYGNVQARCSALQAYAMQWVNLSTMTLGSPAYNAALEAITHNVTDSNKVASKPNHSAINQVRTNEISLSNSNDIIVNPPAAPTWQFREFHLMAGNNMLEQVPPALEPQSKYNGHNGATPADMTLLATWANANSAAIKANNFTVPLTLLPGGQPFQAGKVNYQSPGPLNAPDFWDGSSSPGTGFITDDTTRQVFSSNTCKGCHSAEPKTVFTHINYVGKSTPLQYWSTLSFIFSPSSGAHKTQVSPFLTGVDVILSPGATPPFSSGSYIFGDDSTSVAEDATDNSLTGLFYVKDPAGRTYPSTTVVRKWGFNDLERRAQDLSNFVSSICSPVISVGIAQAAFFKPLNMTH